MIKVKDGYAKLIGTTYLGSASRVLLSNGGDHVLGNASGNIPLNNGTVNTNLNSDLLDGLHAGTSNGTVATYTIFPSYTTLINEGFLESDYVAQGHPDELFLKALCKWATNKYSGSDAVTGANKTTLIGYITPNSSGTCIIHLYRDSKKDPDTLLPKYCQGLYQALNTFLWLFGTCDYVWSYKRFAYASEIKKVTDYYWANIPVSSASNTNTTPTFSKWTTSDLNLVLYTTGGRDLGMRVTGKTNSIGFIIGSSNANRGIYDYTNSNWILVKDANNNIILPSGKIGIGINNPEYKLHVHNGIIKISNNNKYVTIGPENETYTHYTTDTSAHWFNKLVEVNGPIYIYGTTYCFKSDGLYTKELYANRDGAKTYGGISLYSTTDPMTYGIAFRGTETYGKHGYITSDWATYLTMNDQTGRGWIFRRGSTNVFSIESSGLAYADSRISASYYVSRIATGTQPYACRSTTLNTNLNADLLDGIHASELLTSVSSSTETNISITVGGTTKSVSDLYATFDASGNTISTFYLPRVRMTNPSTGTYYHGAIPFVISLKGAGTSIHDDPEFKNGYNNINIYNNKSNGVVTITRIVDDLGSANSSGYILKITNDGGDSSPERGGFIQKITARQNAVFALIFRAKIPSGFKVVNAENNMGNGYTTYWLTDTAGTGKWEWYVRITQCGNGGTYSAGGHVYLSGSGAVTWYLAYCNVIDLTKGDYDGLRTRYADSATNATKSSCVGDSSFIIYPQYNNEINFGGTNTATTIYFGYRVTDSRPIPTSFVFGGTNGTATLTSSGFIKKDSSNDYVLLGGGSHKSISSFQTTYDNRYVLKSGDTMTGNLNIGTETTTSTVNKYLHLWKSDGTNKLRGELCITDKSTGVSYWNVTAGKYTSLRLNGDGVYITHDGSSDPKLYKIWSELNDGANSGLDADLLDGYHASKFVTTDTTLTITGSKTFNTNSNTAPLIIARNNSATEGLKIGVDDSTAHFYYQNDEAANEFIFTMDNTDTENGGGANKNTSRVTFTGNYLGSRVTATYFSGTLNGNADSATKVIVRLHSTDDTEYPLVWSNLRNSNDATANLLYKSYSHLTYNPKHQRLKVAGITAAGHLTLTGNSDIYLRCNDNDESSLVFRSTYLKPYDAADNKISLGTGSARWSNVYSVLGNFTGNVTLYNSNGGDSPRLIFQRGTNTDGTHDFDIYDTSGTLKIRGDLNDGNGFKDALTFYNNTIKAHWALSGNVHASSVECLPATSNVDRPIVGTPGNNTLYHTTKATVNWSTGNITAPTFTGSLIGTAYYATSSPAAVNWGVGTGSSNKIKIKINSTKSWMLSFIVTIYLGYRSSKVMISGYNYGSNYWYLPKAVLLGDSNSTSLDVYFGYDSAWNLWIGFDGGDYTGVSISDVTNGYSQLDSLKDLFTISNVSSLATIQQTITAKNTVSNADTLDGVHANGLLTALSSGTTNKVSITVGGTTKNITTLYASYLCSVGVVNPLTGRTLAYGDVYSYGTHSSAHEGAPTTYSSVIGFGRGTAGTVEICGEWTSGRGLWARALRDVNDDWFTWDRILTEATYKTVLDSRYYTETEVNNKLALYLPLSGGTITGALNFANATWNNLGDDVAIGDCNQAGLLGIKSLNNDYPGIKFWNSKGTDYGTLSSINTELRWMDCKVWHAGNHGAGSGLNADLLDGLHASHFATATSLNNYLPLSGGLMNSTAYISWNNGAEGNDVSDWNITTNGLRIISSARTDTNSPTLYATALHVRGRYGFLLASLGGSTSNNFYIKNVHNTIWNTLIHSNNYTSYTVTKTGSGASGTWGINISGTASTVTVNDLNTTTSYRLVMHNGSTLYSTDGVVCDSKNNSLILSLVVGDLYGNLTHPNPQLCIASESDEIKIVSNSNGNITTNKPDTGSNNYSIRKAVDFRWYDTHWQIGNIRGGSTDTKGFGITYSNNTLCFRVTTSGTYSYYNVYAPHFYENSDKKLKENIQEILNSDNIPQIKEFDWKEDNSHSYGLIAQELEEQGYSELVSVKDDGYKTVNYSAALSLIVGKLQVKIRELEKEIENLKNKN